MSLIFDHFLVLRLLLMFLPLNNYPDEVNSKVVTYGLVNEATLLNLVQQLFF